MYLTVVDGRVHSVQDIENLTIATGQGHPIHLKDFARVLRGKEPTFSVVTADGVDSVLLNIYSQPDASTYDIARQLQARLPTIHKDMPPEVKLAFFYDQSLLVRDSMLSAWEAIIFGLFLSIAILYLFLRSWGTTLVATVVNRKNPVHPRSDLPTSRPAITARPVPMPTRLSRTCTSVKVAALIPQIMAALLRVWSTHAHRSTDSRARANRGNHPRAVVRA